MAHVIIMSAPVQKFGFGGFSDLVRPFGQDWGTVGTGDSDLDLGLTILDLSSLWEFVEELDCQARVQVPNPLSQKAKNPDPKVRPSLKKPKTQFFGLGWHNNHMGHHHPPHPQLLSMKECSGKKVLIEKVAQNDPLDSSSQKND